MTEKLSVDKDQRAHRGAVEGGESTSLVGVSSDAVNVNRKGAPELLEDLAGVGAEMAGLRVHHGDGRGPGCARRRCGPFGCLITHVASVGNQPWALGLSSVKS